MLYVNLYVFGKTIGIPLGCQQRLGLAENHERGKQKFTDGEGSASPANSLSRLLEPKELYIARLDQKPSRTDCCSRDPARATYARQSSCMLVPIIQCSRHAVIAESPLHGEDNQKLH